MNSTPRTPRGAKRWSSAALVIGSTVAVLASPLAIGTSSAATGEVVTIASGAGTNGPAGPAGPGANTATLGITFTPASSATAIDYAIAGGPDVAPGSPSPLPGIACSAPNAGASTCTVKNTSGNVGTDSVIVFADNDSSGSFTSGDSPAATTTVTFSGPPAAVTIAPVRNLATHTITTDTNTCEVYKVSAFDAPATGSEPAGGRPLLVTASETVPLGDGANHFTFSSVDANGNCVAPTFAVGAPTFTNPTTTTHVLNVAALPYTGNDGTFEIGVMSNQAGTGTVQALQSATVNDTDASTWVAGGKNAVTKLTSTPTSSTGYTGTTATFVVTATDAGGNPVQGVSVGEQTNSGPGTVAQTSCPGTTDQNGAITCLLTNGGTSGTDNQTFFVDNDSLLCGHTTGADSCEPQTPVTAEFDAIPTFTTHTLTCVQQLTAGGNQGTAQTDCTVPTSQHAIDFHETLLNAGVAVPNAIVTFAGTAVLGGQAKTLSGTATTDANGVATFSVANVSPQAGDFATITSTKIGNTGLDAGTTGHWAVSAASSLAVTPPIQSVTKGGAVSAGVKVVDQFGTGVATATSLSFTVAGRNNGHNGTLTTDANGAATISYTDAAVNAASATDTISVTGPGALNGSATVNYINGSTTAAGVTVDSSGSGTSDALCGAAGHIAATGVALGHTTEVCAIVQNSFTTPERLAGKSVVFTVTSGQVAAHGALASTSTTTYTALTDSNGVAFADVTSTKSGAQTVTATADAVSGTGTVTYAAPAVATARNVKIDPATATVTAGTPQKFTFTVTDQYGNGVPGATVVATQSGSGILASGNTSVITGPDGTASVQLTTQATDTGTGSVVGSITGGNVCASAAGSPAGTTAGNCTTTATYTIGAPVTPSSLVVAGAPGGKVGVEELVAATVKNSDGTPAVNQVVRYTISGANSAHGAVVTNSKGVGLFGFKPTHAGSNTVTAYDDVNNDQVRESTEPKNVGSVSIAKATEKPTITLSSGKGNVTIHVSTHPVAGHAKVTYYVKSHGSFTKIGSGTTRASGHTSKTFLETKGVTYTFRAKVSATDDVKTGTSKSHSIKVKK